MRHIEAARRITTREPVDPASVKYSLVQRMRAAFHVETVGEGQESFAITASSKTQTYAFTLNVSLKCEKDRIRILADGQNRLKIGTKVFYVLSLLMVMVLSLYQETIESSRYGSIAMNAMFFLVIGGFIIYDHGKKTDEPEAIVESILASLDAEFG